MKIRRRGFTLIEILIVIAILILLAIIVLINMRGQTRKAYDVRRKADLYKLNRSFQDYVNDHDSAPPQEIVNNCDSADLKPYLPAVPCDPQSRKHYGYFPATNGGYRICAILSDPNDPSACVGPLGCGVGGGYNYCVASGVSASAVGTDDEGGGSGNRNTTPTPTPIPGGAWACAPPDFKGVSYCNHYDDPSGSGCTDTFEDRDCLGLCNSSARQCQR